MRRESIYIFVASTVIKFESKLADHSLYAATMASWLGRNGNLIYCRDPKKAQS